MSARQAKSDAAEQLKQQQLIHEQHQRQHHQRQQGEQQQQNEQQQLQALLHQQLLQQQQIDSPARAANSVSSSLDRYLSGGNALPHAGHSAQQGWHCIAGAEASETPTHSVSCRSYNGGGDACVVTGSWDGSCCVFDVYPQPLQLRATLRHSDGLYGVSVALFDAPVVATACADSNVYLWRGFDATEATVLQGHKGEVRPDY